MAHELAVSWILDHQWAIMPEALDTILTIAESANDKILAAVQIAEAQEKLLARQDSLIMQGAKPLGDKSNVYVADGVGVVPISGPVFRHGSMFSDVSGATSLDYIKSNYLQAEQDDSIHSIVLDFHSPGGETTLMDSMSRYIRSKVTGKPVATYASGMLCSAAYWLGSAADEIIVEPSASVGSIGVYGKFKKPGGDGYELISSTQSPDKLLDPTIDRQGAKIQAMIDSVADVFINTVAQNRAVSRNTVLQKFGRGGILIGELAVQAGLADSVGSLDSVISRLANRHNSGFMPSAASLKAQLGDNNMGNFIDKILGREATEIEKRRALAELGLVAGAEPVVQHANLKDSIPEGFALNSEGKLVQLAQTSEPVKTSRSVDPNIQAQLVELDRLKGLEESYKAAMADKSVALSQQMAEAKVSELLGSGKITPAVKDAMASAFAKLYALDAEDAKITFAVFNSDGTKSTGESTLADFFAEALGAKPVLKPTEEVVKSETGATVQALFNITSHGDAGANSADSAMDQRIANMVGAATGKKPSVVLESMHK